MKKYKIVISGLESSPIFCHGGLNFIIDNAAEKMGEAGMGSQTSQKAEIFDCHSNKRVGTLTMSFQKE